MHVEFRQEKTPRVKFFQDDWYNKFPWIRRHAIEVWTPITDFQKVYPQILACTPKCQSLGVHVPPNENVCGHAENFFSLRVDPFLDGL